jgi:hypothetical protein
MELTLDDRRIIHQFKINAHIIFWICLVLSLFANYIVIHFLNIGNTSNLIILNLFLFGFSSFISHMYFLPFKKDLKKGKKTVILEKVIAKKQGEECFINKTLHKKKNFANRKLSFLNKEQYCILVSNRKYQISKKTYDTLAVGDSIEMHFTTESKTLIKIQKHLEI